MLKKIKLIFNTIKYLELSQLYWQLRYRIFQAKPAKKVTGLIQRPIVGFNAFWINKKSFVDQETIELINLSKSYHLPDLWEDRSVDDLWIYNVHYFDFLNNPQVDQDLKLRLVRNWIDDVPKNSIGWQAYPTSLRIVNWVKWILANNIQESRIICSLSIQTQHLRNNFEFHILANHLFANIKALIVASLFFQGEVASQWLSFAENLLQKEIKKQFLQNGGHFELAPMYHQIMLEDVLDLISFYQLYRKQAPSCLVENVSRMLVWSKAMSHPDGEVAFFNDSVVGIAPMYETLNQYAINLGLKPQKTNNIIADCDGYFVVNKNKWDLKFDAAELGAKIQPGHAHADTLSFELSVGDQRVFVNSGISTYHNLHQRQFQRSTQAHNTLLIDGKSSSQMWSKFRVADRAKVLTRLAEHDDNKIVLSASHDGYCNKKINIIHQRNICVSHDSVVIDDFVSGLSHNQVDVCFYLHPDVKVDYKDNDLYLLLPSCRLKITSTYSVQVNASEYHPSFNQIQNNMVLQVSELATGPFTNKLTIDLEVL